jgi:hypothetical protein
MELGSYSLPLSGPFVDVQAYLARRGITPDATGFGEGTDASEALNEIFQAAPTNTAQTFWFGTTPADYGYRLSSPLRPKRAHRLIGNGCTAVQGCRLYSDHLVTGLIVDTVSTGGADTTTSGLYIDGIAFNGIRSGYILRATSYAIGTHRYHHNSNRFTYRVQSWTDADGATPGTTAASTDVADWTTTPGNTYTDGGVVWVCEELAHGIEIHAPCTLKNVAFRGFAGDGLHLTGSFSIGTNLNFTGGWEGVKVSNVVGKGMYVAGTDAQACEFSGVTLLFCEAGGLYDVSDCGNTYTKLNIEFCGSTDLTPNGGFTECRSIYSLSDNGPAVFNNPYVEGGGWIYCGGQAVWFSSQALFTPGFENEAGTPTTYGRNITNQMRVRNATRDGSIWAVTVNQGYGDSAPPTLLHWVQEGGVNISGSLRRMEETSPNEHGMIQWYDANAGDAVWAIRCVERGMPTAFIAARELRVGVDTDTFKGSTVWDPSYKTAGLPLWGEAVYERSGANFTPGGPSYERGRSPTNATGATSGGMRYARWVPDTAYTVGQLIVDSNGRIQRRTQNGTSHAATEPTWATTFGSTTTDNGVADAWTAGIAAGTTVNGQTVSTYASTTDYTAGNLIVPAVRDGFIYRIDYDANSGAGTPTFAGFMGTQISHNDLRLRRWGFDLAGVLWYPGPNTSGTPL